jgi:hypothetical protein
MTTMTSSRGLPTLGPPHGTPIFMLVSVQVRPHTSTRTALCWLCWSCLFTANFQLLLEHTNLHYQQHVGRQAGPSCEHLTLHCQTWWLSLPSSADGTHLKRHNAWLLV